MRPLAEQQLPPITVGKIRVVRAPAAGILRYTILSHAHWGCWSHWCGNHTEACFCTQEERDCAPPSLVHRWKGFLHVQEDGTGRQFFLEITDLAMNELLAKLRDGETLRGLITDVFRQPQHSRGSILIKIRDRRKNLATLPPERNPKPVLEKLWKTKLPSGNLVA